MSAISVRKIYTTVKFITFIQPNHGLTNTEHMPKHPPSEFNKYRSTLKMCPQEIICTTQLRLNLRIIAFFKKIYRIWAVHVTLTSRFYNQMTHRTLKMLDLSIH